MFFPGRIYDNNWPTRSEFSAISFDTKRIPGRRAAANPSVLDPLYEATPAPRPSLCRRLHPGWVVLRAQPGCSRGQRQGLGLASPSYSESGQVGVGGGGVPGVRLGVEGDGPGLIVGQLLS